MALFWEGLGRMNKLYIIGVGASGVDTLTFAARERIREAEILFGGRRWLNLFADATARKNAIGNNLAEVVASIEANSGQRIVVLASGDPNLYGIARYLVDRLGKETVEIIPNVSAMQLAFARIKECWDDATIVSVHGRPIEEIIESVRASRKVGIFTDHEHTPAAIARCLLANGIDGYRAFVCQNLGDDGERVIETDLEQLCNQESEPLNVLILIRCQQESTQKVERALGIPDEEFEQRRPRRGLITKLEIRVVSLAKLGLLDESIVWDIGAGSGAVSIEAAHLARRGHVYAIEDDPEDIAIINENVSRFGAKNVTVLHAIAPDALVQLPDPSAVFIGGSKGMLRDILDVVCRRLKTDGSVVINLATLENLSTAMNALQARGFVADVTLLNVSRSRAIADLTRLQAFDPVFVLAAKRKEASR